MIIKETKIINILVTNDAGNLNLFFHLRGGTWDQIKNNVYGSAEGEILELKTH